MMRLATAAVIAAMLLTGCDGGGIKRYTVSGTVTYEGKPMPWGFARLEPDSSKGNSGPGAGAQVKDGSYETPAGKGIVGGPHNVTVYANDGIATTINGEAAPEGKPLFPEYKTQV